MAKWGEGDSRWIVEKRDDATNVNNWHWTEKNCTPWSKSKLKEVLLNISIDKGDSGTAGISTIDSIDGEATANQRKGKLIFFYEFVLDGKWKGKLGDDEVKGTWKIPNLSEENDPDEVDFEVSTSDSSPAGRKLRDVMAKEGSKLVVSAITEWLKELKESYSSTLIKPTPKAGADSAGSNGASPAAQRNEKTLGSPLKTKAKSTVSSVVTIEETIEFSAPADELYKCFVEPERIQAYTQAPAELKNEVGGEFKFLHGNVSGVFTTLEPGKQIGMQWRLGSWHEGHHSNVVMTFKQLDDRTVLTMKQTGVPMSEEEETRSGWRAQFFDRIKMTFGMGYVM
eukprot:Clim_evm62s33 gene=Clim_evmTU62s33